METTQQIKQLLKTNDEEYIRIISGLHKSLVNGMRSGKTNIAKRWLQERKLTSEISGACYNSGQIHHRKEQSYKDELESTGFLTECNAPTNNGQIPYTIFGRYSIIFPLRNKDQDVINFYAISLKDNNTSFLNEDGIYPRYPKHLTEKLYVVTSVIEASVLLEARAMNENEAVMSLFDGEFKPQHYGVISELKNLKEIIIIEKKNKDI